MAFGFDECRFWAQVAELVDALASGASFRKEVEVRVFSWAPINRIIFVSRYGFRTYWIESGNHACRICLPSHLGVTRFPDLTLLFLRTGLQDGYARTIGVCVLIYDGTYL